MSAGHPLRANDRAAHCIPKTIGIGRKANGGLDDERFAEGARSAAKQLNRRHAPVVHDQQVNLGERVRLELADISGNCLRHVAMPSDHVAVARELAQEALLIGNLLQPVEISASPMAKVFSQVHPRPVNVPVDFRKHPPFEKLERRRP